MKILQYAVLGFFGAIIAFIVFVRAGSGKSGQSGGQQTAQIIQGFGKAGGDLASGLESS